jgi:hypothetical protein
MDTNTRNNSIGFGFIGFTGFTGSTRSDKLAIGTSCADSVGGGSSVCLLELAVRTRLMARTLGAIDSGGELTGCTSGAFGIGG